MAWVKVTGDASVAAAIQRFGRNMAAMGPILLEGAREMQHAIQGKASFWSRTGEMRRSIVAKLLPAKGTATVPTALAGIDLKLIDKRDAKGDLVPYPYFTQYGVKPHEIAANRKTLRFGQRFGDKVKHPGARPRDFFGRGVAAGRYPARKRIEAGLIALARRSGATEVGL